ncbi:MAG: DUF1284 domain-containing protein [Elusimicrobiota bacterium]
MEHIRIRAHHLLCMQGFQGYGYSRDFVDNMKRIIKEIDSNPDLTVELTNGGDSICEYCPHFIDTCCKSAPNADARVNKMDNVVLKTINISSGTVGKITDFFSIVNNKFQTLSGTKKVCRTCTWKKECLWYKSRIKK